MKSIPSIPNYYTEIQVANFLKISREELKQMNEDNSGPPWEMKLGFAYYKKSEFARWQSRQKELMLDALHRGSLLDRIFAGNLQEDGG
jgi:hypothetical protein